MIVLEIVLPFALVIGFCAFELWRLRRDEGKHVKDTDEMADK